METKPIRLVKRKVSFSPSFQGDFLSAILFLIVVLALAGCGASYLPTSSSVEESTSQDSLQYGVPFVGYMVYDVDNEKVVSQQNAYSYFTPASNTKLLTFYSALQLLPDTLPTLSYTKRGDTLYIGGYADPSFLHPSFDDQYGFQFLQSTASTQMPIVYCSADFQTTLLGYGWAWDDYLYPFSAERYALPMYANISQWVIHQEKIESVLPALLIDSAEVKVSTALSRNEVYRGFDDNRFVFTLPQARVADHIRSPDKRDTIDIPMHMSDRLVVQMLSDTLHSPVFINDTLSMSSLGSVQALGSTPADTVYRKMMYESDNFIAEQLLLMISKHYTDTISTSKAIGFISDTLFTNSPQPLVWVDGSGLSRYNMFTPAILTYLLQDLYKNVDHKRLFSLLASPGKGTLKNYFVNAPFEIHAKTGTLRNNHCLSGYVTLRSGRRFIFSVMVNHYTQPTSEIHRYIERLLTSILSNYQV